MKKIVLILIGTIIGSFLTYGQGTVALYYTGGATYGIYTNNGVVSGLTAGTANYYYALLTATYGGAAPANNPTNAVWTFSGNYATNYLNTGGIRGAGAAAGFACSGFALANGSYLASTPSYYMIVGWSANLGSNWTTISSEIGNWTSTGYFGYSSVAYQVAGNPSQSINAVNLYGDPSGYSGAGLTNGFTLNLVSPTATPEPSTLALAALGGASLLLFRRRKV